MYNEQQIRIRLAKRIVLITLSVAAVVALGLSTAMLLRNITDKTQDNSQPSGSASSQSTTAPSAASVIRGYVEPQTAKVLTDHYSLQQGGVQPILYKADDKSYQINVETSHYALFTAKNGYAHNDKSDVTRLTDSYLTSLGYKKQAGSGAGPEYATYVNDGAVCQLTTQATATQALYSLACADNTAVSSVYQRVDDLIALYQKDNRLTSFSSAYVTTAKESDKAMTIISLSGKNQHSRLLFAAVGGKWEYLGDLSGDTNASNGKYSITPSVQAAISQAKYGDFLTRNLQ